MCVCAYVFVYVYVCVCVCVCVSVFVCDFVCVYNYESKGRVIIQCTEMLWLLPDKLQCICVNIIRLV